MEIGELLDGVTLQGAAGENGEDVEDIKAFRSRDFSAFLDRLRDVRARLVQLQTVRPRVQSRAFGSGFELTDRDQRNTERALTEFARELVDFFGEHRFDLDEETKDFVRGRLAAVLVAEGLTTEGDPTATTDYGIVFDFAPGSGHAIEVMTSKLRSALESDDGLELAELFTSRGGGSNLTSALIAAFERIETDLEDGALPVAGLGVLLDLEA